MQTPVPTRTSTLITGTARVPSNNWPVNSQPRTFRAPNESNQNVPWRYRLWLVHRLSRRSGTTTQEMIRSAPNPTRAARPIRLQSSLGRIGTHTPSARNAR